MKRFLLTIFILSVTAINSFSQENKYIALTFDDGPHIRYTLEILDILKENNATATFFVIGENAKEHPELIEKIVDSGCEIGNHTWSHAFLDALCEKDIRKEMSLADEIITELTGKAPTLFRAPGGRINDTVLKVADEFGYTSVLWSKDTRDWSCPSVSYVISAATDKSQNGDIILFHDYNAKNSPTPEALRIVLPKLINEGYTPVTVTELLGKINARQ